jgi:hypothetical protein
MTFDEEIDALHARLRALAGAEASARAEEARADAESRAAAREAALRAELEEAAQARVATVRNEALARLAAREQSLRAEIADETQAHIGRLQGEIDALREAMDKARDESDAARADIEARAAARAEAAEAAHDVAVARTARLRDDVAALDEARSLGQVLDALAGGAGQEVARAAVLILEGEAFVAWRLVGFSAVVESGGELRVPIGQNDVLSAAVASKTPVEGGGGAHPPPEFAELPAGHPCFAAPLLLDGQVVAVVYADQGGDAAAPSPLGPAIPSLDVLARHAGSRLEALTAFLTAATLAGRPAGPRTSMPGTQLHRPPRDDDDESARRYARLLVSEIRLYHEADVAEGRRCRDLTSRLAPEIGRARAMYEQRVPPDVRRRTDYFNAELVRTLADGDARLLEVDR